MNRRKFLIVTAAAFAVSSCSSGEKYETIKSASIRPGDSVPRPKGDVILTISGKIDHFNNGVDLDFDMETLKNWGSLDMRLMILI